MKPEVSLPCWLVPNLNWMNLCRCCGSLLHVPAVSYVVFSVSEQLVSPVLRVEFKLFVVIRQTIVNIITAAKTSNLRSYWSFFALFLELFLELWKSRRI